MTEPVIYEYNLPAPEDVLGVIIETMKMQARLQDTHPQLTAQERLWISAQCLLPQVESGSRCAGMLERLSMPVRNGPPKIDEGENLKERMRAKGLRVV